MCASKYRYNFLTIRRTHKQSKIESNCKCFLYVLIIFLFDESLLIVFIHVYQIRLPVHTLHLSTLTCMLII